MIQNKENIKMEKREDKKEKSGELDIWSSIFLTQNDKDEASKLKTLPYIHPLEKKSKSFLSEKSLQICTESLGSETGSDDFSSSNTSSEDNNSEDDEKFKEEVKTCDEFDDVLKVPKYNNYYYVKKSPSFPPPLSSLSTQSQHGQSQTFQMRSHRDNGRLFLFLQTVSVPSQNFFAKRQNGRLILTFVNHDEEEKDCNEIAIEKTQMLSSGLELTVKKLIGLVNKSPKWSNKFNKVPNFEDVKVVQHGSLPRSLPFINGYQYYWRTKAIENVVAPLIPNNDAISDQQNSIGNKVVVSENIYYKASNQASQQLLVMRGKNGGYLVHNLKFCKDFRTSRSFMFWDTCCVAT
ncbi:protein FAF-like, chloroplastic [Cicer arietinum]|uniref:Protein FAF-like, chloroplastic n=1 Tax=Cicer arietinum TaxID=3827 RepID=A0A1S2XD09_CICAR|nr:protein FAF-like, chloroplastic [Cicer arietinum]